MKNFHKAVLLTIAGICLVSASANATESVLSPDPVFAAMNHPIDDLYFEIWVGNFDGGYDATDVNQSTLLINSSLTPASIEIGTHPDFTGDALKLTVLSTDFLPAYGTLWDTQLQGFTVEGEFDDTSLLAVASTFTSVGHITGDANSDGRFNVRDLTFLVDLFFRGGPEPPFPPSADVNGSCGDPDINDMTYIIDRIFRGGPAPAHCPNL